MNSKFLILLFSALFLRFSLAFAQSQSDEIQLYQTIWGMEKKAIVKDYMHFTKEEETTFWPIFDELQIEQEKLGEVRLKTIAEYVKNIDSLTNEKADDMATKLLNNNADLAKLQVKYYKKIKKSISSIRAAQFMQLELYLQTMARVQAQNSVPFIGELQKKAKKKLE